MENKPQDIEEKSTLVVEEPTTVFTHRTSDLSSLYSCSESVSKPGRMTVKEYFDELWDLYLKKSEDVQS